eukprot:1134670-Pelagomonas_calceolata.AAC.1
MISRQRLLHVLCLQEEYETYCCFCCMGRLVYPSQELVILCRQKHCLWLLRKHVLQCPRIFANPD